MGTSAAAPMAQVPSYTPPVQTGFEFVAQPSNTQPSAASMLTATPSMYGMQSPALQQPQSGGMPTNAGSFLAYPQASDLGPAAGGATGPAAAPSTTPGPSATKVP